MLCSHVSILLERVPVSCRKEYIKRLCHNASSNTSISIELSPIYLWTTCIQCGHSLQAHHLKLYILSFQCLSSHEPMEICPTDQSIPLTSLNSSENQGNTTTWNDPDTIAFPQALRPDTKISQLSRKRPDHGRMRVMRTKERCSTLQMCEVSSVEEPLLSGLYDLFLGWKVQRYGQSSRGW